MSKHFQHYAVYPRLRTTVFTTTSICKTNSLAMLTRSHPSHCHTGFLLSALLCHSCLLVDAQGSAVLTAFS